MDERDEEWPAATLVTRPSFLRRYAYDGPSRTRAIEAIPAMTPFVGPEQLMREHGLRELVRLGANESAFGPSPKAIARDERRARASGVVRRSRIARFARRARRASTPVDPEQIVVGAGIDDLMGLAVRAFVAPGGARADDARHVSDVRLSRDRLRRNAGRSAVSRRRHARSRRAARRLRERSPRRSSTLPIPTIRADVSSRATTSRVSTMRCPPTRCCSGRSLRRFRRPSRTVAGRHFETA